MTFFEGHRLCMHEFSLPRLNGCSNAEPRAALRGDRSSLGRGFLRSALQISHHRGGMSFTGRALLSPEELAS